MTTTVSAVISRREAQEGKPSITYRYAGDSGVLVEYGRTEQIFHDPSDSRTQAYVTGRIG